MKTKCTNPELQPQRWFWLLATTVIIASCGTLAEQNTAPSPVPSTSLDMNATSSAPASSPVGTPITVVTETERSADELWSLLQQADNTKYVVLIRHAIAPGGGDPPTFELEDCSTQRNLSDAGRQQAVRIGEAFRSRNVPVAQVLSSQWCRCLETAELMNLGQVEPFSPLNSFFSDRSTAEQQTTQVQQFLLKNQDVPGVTLMVSHQVNITALTNISPQSGEAVVMEINDDNQFTILGRIPMS